MMEATTPAATVTSARSQLRHADPALNWAPWSDLTAAAAQAAGDSGTVAITRGFGRTSRQRAKALRDLLNERGLAAIELTPAPGSERLVADTKVDAVINMIGAGSWQPYRIAAKLGAPVLTPRPGETAGEEAKRSVIGLSTDTGERDVALSHVALRPEDPAAAQLLIEHDGEQLTVPGGSVTIALQEENLEVKFGGTDVANRTLTAQQVRVAATGSLYQLVRDEMPIADYEGAITFEAEPNALIVRPV